MFFSVSGAITPNNITNDNSAQAPSSSVITKENKQDIITLLFSNSLTSMLLSTFIIGIVGVLINKLRTFKKKLDMIEILTKSQVKMKQQAEQRDEKFEKRYIDSQNDVSSKISQLCVKLDKQSDELNDKLDNATNNLNNKLDIATNNLNQKIDTKTDELEKQIDVVKDETTKTLIDYLKQNSLGRKR